MTDVLGIYDAPADVAEAERRLRGRGYTDLETYAPAPFTEVDDAVIEKPSRVRLFTLIGGLTGVVTGYAMTIWMANDWKIMLGGKPFSSIPPYTIIAFELTILFGRLPSTKIDPAYSARFSAEEFGVRVRCRERDVAEVEALMRSYHAKVVTLVWA